MTGQWPGRKGPAGVAQESAGPSSTRGGAHTLPCIRAGAAATVVRGHAVGLAAAGTREGRSEAMTGTSPERYISAVTIRPGARLEETTQHGKVAARRANAGLPADREAILHVHEKDDSPSRSHGRARERAPERRSGAAGCLGPAATSDGRAPAMSTLAWHTFRPSGPRSASRSSSDARLSTEERRRNQSPRVRVTSPASWRRSVQAHMPVAATAMCGIGRSNRVAARLVGTVPRQDEGLSRLPAVYVAHQQLRIGGPHVGPPVSNEGTTNP